MLNEIRSDDSLDPGTAVAPNPARIAGSSQQTLKGRIGSKKAVWRMCSIAGLGLPDISTQSIATTFALVWQKIGKSPFKWEVILAVRGLGRGLQGLIAKVYIYL